ncbi:MAG: clostripain-related cysteine peptidase [Bacteroidales bacterium]
MIAYLTKIALLIVIIFTSSCSKQDEVIGPTEDANRTVVIYMAADNSLWNYALRDLNDIISGVENGNLNGSNLIVYIDSQYSLPILYKIEIDESGRGVKREIKSYAEHNSADHKVMSTILKEAFASYPAKTYGLVLWSHGYGWIPSNTKYKSSYSELYNSFGEFGQDRFPTKWFGQDISSNSYMDIPNIKTALNDLPHLEFIAFDACFMSSLEVIDQLKERAKYIMAAPTEIHAVGFPYSTIIEPMFRLASPDLYDMCDKFYEFYLEYNKEVSPLYQTATISLIKSEEVEALSNFVRASILKYKDAIKELDINTIQHFERVPEVTSNPLMYDLEDYLSRVINQEEKEELTTLLNNCVIKNLYTPNFINLPLSKCSGLSFYIPQESFEELNIAHYNLGW